MFMGLEGFVWFQGVVEDRTGDPLKLGRLKVRILGHHPVRKSSNQGIRTEELLWCYPMTPITNAAMNGIGQSPNGVVEGTWVFGFFRDSKLRQDPVIMGTVGGIPRDLPNESLGFNDPNAVYPKEDFLNEPDVNRLARNDTHVNLEQPMESEEEPDYIKREHPIIASKIEAERKEIPTAGYNANGPVYDEPPTPYAAVYPYNHVYESESGHIREVDDTEGHERLHTYHRSGTFEEIHPDGTKVTKVVGDDYQIIVRDNNVLIEGNMNITVNGNASLYCKQNVTQQIDGDLKQHVKGNVDMHTEGNVTQTVDQNVTQVVHQNVEQTVDGDVTQTIQGNVTQSVGQNVNQTVSGNVQSTTDGDYMMFVGGSYTVTVGGEMVETVTGSMTRTALSISDDGGGATLNLAGAASLDGTTINLG